MGKKGKWLTSVKSALHSPIKEGDDAAEPEQQEEQEKPKQKARRWSFGTPDEGEPEKRRDGGQHRDAAVLSNSKFAMYMYPSQEEWAAVVIQTAFRGYLARKSLRTLRGLVRLQSSGRGQESTAMQALVHIQAHRVRMSEEGLAAQHQMWQRGQPASRNASDWLTEAGWIDSTLSAQQIEAKVPERQVAALKRERALAYARTQQQMRRASPMSVMPLFIECKVQKAQRGWSYMERWSSARPGESRILDSPSASKDAVADSTHASKSVDVRATRNAKDTNGRCASLQAVTTPPQARAGSGLNVRAGSGPWNRQSRAASPQSRDAEELGSVARSATASRSATARSMASILTDPQFGTRYSNPGPVRNSVIMIMDI